jgi:hypothetical protein
MKISLLISTFLVLFFLSFAAHAGDDYKVIFETMDCSGNTGFATVGADEIYKMNNGDCTDPNDPAKRLKQLLVHDGSGSYIVYTLTQDEARNVMMEMKEYMKSRKGVLDRSDAIIISQ